MLHEWDWPTSTFELANGSGLVEQLRAVKDAVEIELMRRCGEVAVGQLETEIAAITRGGYREYEVAMIGWRRSGCSERSRSRERKVDRASGCLRLIHAITRATHQFPLLRRPGIGVLRSDDHGKTWRSIAKGLPSDFGFPILVHPHDADTVYVMPLEPMTRSCPGGAPAVWRSEDGGDSWQRLARGFPKKESFFTVQRDAMDIDEIKSPALYLGTTTGQLWIGREGGEEWSCVFDSLPPIHCVKAAVV